MVRYKLFTAALLGAVGGALGTTAVTLGPLAAYPGAMGEAAQRCLANQADLEAQQADLINRLQTAGQRIATLQEAARIQDQANLALSAETRTLGAELQRLRQGHCPTSASHGGLATLQDQLEELQKQLSQARAALRVAEQRHAEELAQADLEANAPRPEWDIRLAERERRQRLAAEAALAALQAEHEQLEAQWSLARAALPTEGPERSRPPGGGDRGAPEERPTAPPYTYYRADSYGSFLERDQLPNPGAGATLTPDTCPQGLAWLDTQTGEQAWIQRRIWVRDANGAWRICEAGRDPRPPGRGDDAHLVLHR